MSDETCTGPDCEYPQEVKKWSLCSAHNQQRRAGKKLTPVRRYKKGGPPTETCPVPNCTRGIKARGLCTPHASVTWRMSIHPEDYPGVAFGKCAICPRVEPLVQDHDHSCCPTGYSCGDCLRGSICQKCNLLIGHIENCEGEWDPERYIQYLDDPPGVAARAFVPATVDTHKGRAKKRAGALSKTNRP